MKDHLVLINTTRCNFQCKHCIRDYYSNNADIPLSILDKVLHEVKDLGYKHVALTGGEVSLHPEFDNMMDIICDKHGYDWSFVTNGYSPMKYEYSISKYQNKCKSVAVSLDGGMEKTHDYIRRPGSYQKALESLDYFKSHKLKTKIAFTANSLNLDEKRNVLKIALEHEVDELRFTAIIPNHFNQELKLTQKQREQLDQFIEKLINDGFPIRITHTTMLHTSSDVDHFCDNINNPEPAINPYGEYIFCCDTGGRGAVIGDLREKSFSELYIDQIKKSVWLKNKRKELIENGDMFTDFNSCHFCNKLLLDY